MKKIACLLLSLLLLSVTGACSGDSDDNSEGPSPGVDAGADTSTGGDDTGGAQDDQGTVDTQVAEEPEWECIYPEYTGEIGCGEVMPPLAWENAYWGDGTAVDFSVKDFYCSDEYSDYLSIAFIIVTETCPYCPDYVRAVVNSAAQLEAAGSLVVFVDGQNSSGRRPNNDGAKSFFERLIGESEFGLRVGDADTQPRAGALYDSVDGVPSGYVARRHDMVIVADQTVNEYLVDYVDVAQNIDTASCAPPEPNCEATEEEEFEPNSTPESAGVLEADCYVEGVCTVEGGVCAYRDQDFYRIEIEGDWRLDLLFEHAVGDLDVYVWDEETGAIRTNRWGDPVGSESTSDNESLSYRGPTTVVVWGYLGATATYTLKVTDLSE